MKKFAFFASTALVLSAGIASAQEVKMGVLLGYTGPIEDITPYMADSAELAMKEISDSGLFLGGATITPVRADSTCVDSSAAQAAAERLISSDGIVAMVGADCSGVTMAVLQKRGDVGGCADDLALCDFASLHHDRIERTVLPHRAVRCAPRRDSGRYRAGAWFLTPWR